MMLCPTTADGASEELNATRLRKAPQLSVPASHAANYRPYFSYGRSMASLTPPLLRGGGRDTAHKPAIECGCVQRSNRLMANYWSTASRDCVLPTLWHGGSSPPYLVSW